MTLSARIGVDVTAKSRNVLDLGSASHPVAFTAFQNLATGVGASQANRIFTQQRSISANGSILLDLSAAALTDASGNGLELTSIKALIVQAKGTNTNDVVVGGASKNAASSMFGGASGKVKVKPGGLFALSAPNADGYPIVAGSADILRIGNGGGGSPVTYTLILIGTAVELPEPPTIMVPPTGLDFPSLPVTIYSDRSTDFDPEDWKVAATADIWVATTGNDTTGTGSEAQPYATIKKALTEAALRPDTALNIYVLAGTYTFNQNFSNTACDKDLNIIAVGGRVLSSNKFPITNWTPDGTGTYRATRSGVPDASDRRYPVTWPNGDQTPQLLAQAADLAACQAAAGSWYTNNTSVWLHLQDGRVPDAGVGGDVSVYFGNPMLLMTHNRKWYVEGFDFESANTSLVKVQPAAGASVQRLVMNDCTFRFQRTDGANSAQCHSLDLAILFNCRSFESEGDAFNYSTVSLPSSPSTKAVEINCAAFNCGRPATNGGIINGSTNHGGGRAVRVNGYYRNTYGPVCADINTSRNWYIGCDIQNCLLADDSVQDAAVQALNTAQTWLDGCVVGGAHYDLYAAAGAAIRYRNMTIAGLTAGDVATY